MDPLITAIPMTIIGYMGGRYLIGKAKNNEPKTDKEIEDWVISQACDAYAEGKIDLSRLERDIENLLRGRTPVDKEGWPIYYDPRILDKVNY